MTSKAMQYGPKPKGPYKLWGISVKLSCMDEEKLPKEVTTEIGLDCWKEAIPMKINMVTVPCFPYMAVWSSGIYSLKKNMILMFSQI